MDLCWFCEERETSPDASIKVRIRLTLAHGGNAKRNWTHYREKIILIPRCSRCRRERLATRAYSLVAAFLSLGLGVAAGALLVHLFSVSQVLGIVVGSVVGLCCLVGMLYIIVKHTPVGAYKNKNREIKDHPIVQSWTGKGWVVT